MSVRGAGVRAQDLRTLWVCGWEGCRGEASGHESCVSLGCERYRCEGSGGGEVCGFESFWVRDG